jgi:hypothetical protein
MKVPWIVLDPVLIASFSAANAGDTRLHQSSNVESAVVGGAVTGPAVVAVVELWVDDDDPHPAVSTNAAMTIGLAPVLRTKATPRRSR